MEKPVALLEVADLLSSPIWEFVNDDPRDDTLVRPVAQLPVSHLDGRLVATQAVLAEGERVWALLGNVDVHNPGWTKHVITISIERQRTWFTLARYHDVDYAERGPQGLAAFLGRPVSDVFPISYDLRQHVIGEVSALVGKLDEHPGERLSRADIIAMSVRSRQRMR